MALLGSQRHLSLGGWSIPDPSVVLAALAGWGWHRGGLEGTRRGSCHPWAAAEVPSLADSRKLQQKGEFTAQSTEGNYEFLNLFWMDSTILLLASLKLFSFQLLFVLTPSRLQHKTQDPDESWHL